MILNFFTMQRSKKKPVFSNTGINAGKVQDIKAEYVFLFS